MISNSNYRIAPDRWQLTDLAINSLSNAVPGVLILASLYLLSREIHPQFTKKDSINEEGLGEYIITHYTESDLKKITRLFLQKLPLGLRTEDVERIYVGNLLDLRKFVLSSAIALKFPKVDIGFSFSDGSDTFPMGTYTALGGRSTSYYSQPYMSYHLNTAREIENLSGRENRVSIKAKKFIAAHEVSHIVCNHTFVVNIVNFAYGLFNIIIWKESRNHDYSISATFGIALTVAFIYKIFFNMRLRYQERQADLLACDALGSNEEAIAYFEELIQSRKEKPFSSSMTHPPASERLAYVKSWKKK